MFSVWFLDLDRWMKLSWAFVTLIFSFINTCIIQFWWFIYKVELLTFAFEWITELKTIFTSYFPPKIKVASISCFQESYHCRKIEIVHSPSNRMLFSTCCYGNSCTYDLLVIPVDFLVGSVGKRLRPP